MQKGESRVVPGGDGGEDGPKGSGVKEDRQKISKANIGLRKNAGPLRFAGRFTWGRNGRRKGQPGKNGKKKKNRDAKFGKTRAHGTKRNDCMSPPRKRAENQQPKRSNSRNTMGGRGHSQKMLEGTVETINGEGKREKEVSSKNKTGSRAVEREGGQVS